MMMKVNKLIDYLDELFPNPKCELNYNSDYELLIAVMLSAQTTDKRVNGVTEILFNKYDSLKKLSEANIDDLKVIIRSLGSYNKKAANVKQIALKLLEKGCFPNDREFLESMPGVGRKTTNVVLNNIFHENYFAVDTHVQRVSIRLGIASEKDNVLEIENKLIEYFKDYNINKISDQLVLYGRYHCMAKKPNCENCKIKDICEYEKKND